MTGSEISPATGRRATTSGLAPALLPDAEPIAGPATARGRDRPRRRSPAATVEFERRVREFMRRFDHPTSRPD